MNESSFVGTVKVRKRLFHLGEMESRQRGLMKKGQDVGSSFVDFEAEMSDDEGHTDDENEDALEEELVRS